MKVTALCLVGAVLAALLKKSSPELALLLALAACASLRRSTRLTGRSWGKSRSSGGCCATGCFRGS